jgi:hypothetical protein
MVNLINYNTNRPLWNFDVHKLITRNYDQPIIPPIQQNEIWTDVVPWTVDDIHILKMVSQRDSCHSQANPLHPSENPTNSHWQPIVFGNSRLSSSNIRFRPNVYSAFLLTARYSIIQDNGDKKSYHHVQRKYRV